MGHSRRKSMIAIKVGKPRKPGRHVSLRVAGNKWGRELAGFVTKWAPPSGGTRSIWDQALMASAVRSPGFAALIGAVDVDRSASAGD
jgi:hypothetical protein